MISIQPFGTTPDGRPVTAYELSAECAPARVRVRVMDFGATLVGVDAPDRDGRMRDVLLGFDGLAGYLDDPACFGATIGPSANRTDRAEVPLGGQVYRLPANDGPGRANNLHTDLARGLHKRLWDAEPDEAANAVRLTCRLADGELGLPGARTFTAVYALAAGADGSVRLTLDYACETDAETYVNMTNHSYFNLAGAGSGSVLNQVARIRAERFLPVRADSVSEGPVLPVAGTPFDFRAPKALGTDIDADDEQLRRAHGYDHCFCVDGYEPGAPPRPALSVEDPASGRALDILITAPGAHLYTGNWLDDAPVKGGGAYGPRDGFAFEPEFWPDNAHHADWEHPVCAPGRPYRSEIVYRFSAR